VAVETVWRWKQCRSVERVRHCANRESAASCQSRECGSVAVETMATVWTVLSVETGVAVWTVGQCGDRCDSVERVRHRVNRECAASCQSRECGIVSIERVRQCGSGDNVDSVDSVASGDNVDSVRQWRQCGQCPSVETKWTVLPNNVDNVASGDNVDNVVVYIVSVDGLDLLW
jgi:hypothetical protein